VFGVLGVFGAQADSWTIPVTEDARTVIHWVDANRRDDPVYVLHESLPAWAFYTTDWERPDSAHLADIRAATFRNSREIVLHHRTLSRSAQGGADLVRAIDLLGSHSDAAWREGAGWVGGEGIGRWANEEAAQIRAATSDYIWVVASHYRPEELQALLQDLHELGGSVVQSYQLTGAEAYRLRLRHSESPRGG
jgi:hypothetical protein